jgi:asparagine synthase (glutamine-hydrolysing)
MSAIVGIYYPDGQPVDQTDLQRMAASVAHRGPDGAGVWSEGSVGLSHRMLWTTPESLQEKLPLMSQTGDLVLTADARIDNRHELAAALGLSKHPSLEISDSQLILAAYEKWSDRCPERLLGDFAFAIWDGRKRVLFCARDHFGVKPFYYYYLASQIFAFASEIKALLCLPEVPRQLNEIRVADYLASMMEDKTITFYQHILRLPPAHSITVSHNVIRVQPYWSLDPSRELRLNSDEEYAAAFRELFTKAVACRLRSVFPMGTHLSGGLDSSAVTCVARELLALEGEPRLHTFSNIFDQVPQCDERPFINAILSQGDFLPHFVHADRAGPLADLERVLRHQDEPFLGPNHFLPWGLNRAAQQAGVRIVLDGFDGDTTVSHGAVYLSELARQGRWETFAKEAHAVSQHFEVSPLRLLHHYGLTYLEELANKYRWVAFAAAVQHIHKYFAASRWHLFLHHGLKPLIPELRQLPWWAMYGCSKSVNSIDPIINPGFARRVGLKHRLQVLAGFRENPPCTAREDQWRSLTSGLFVLVLELSDRCAAAFAIEARHPFMDKRLIEFCLALPPEQKLHQGWSRIVMRRALADVLPEQVRWRGGKTDMTQNFIHGFLTFDRELLEEVILHKVGNIEEYVDTHLLRETYHRSISSEKVKTTDLMTLWKVVTLSQWLRYSGLKA